MSSTKVGRVMLAKSSVSLSHYVDTMALLSPSHDCVSLGRSGTEAILGPIHFVFRNLSTHCPNAFIRLASVQAFKQADRSRR